MFYDIMGLCEDGNTSNNSLNYTLLSALPKDPKVAMAYIPFQTETMLYNEDEALAAGTLFSVLDKPFLGGGKKCK